MTGLRADAVTLARGGVTVLRDVSLALRGGEVLALLGPNGAGKSTLLALLAGLHAADAGQVLLDGQPLGALPARTRARRIGFLPQGGEVHWAVDVATLVALGRLPHQGRGGMAAADRAAVARAMAATGVAHLSGRPVDRLSGGERARVLFARVLAGEPDWLLADEPLAGLDPAHQLDALGHLRAAAARGTGVVVVLHDLNQAAQIADRVALLRAGELLALGATVDVLTPPTIRRCFGVAVETGRLADGRPWLLPVGPA